MKWLWCSNRSRIAVATTDTAVGGDEHRTSFIAPGHELEEQMGCIRVERKIANLVDDEQLGLGEKREPLFRATSPCALTSVGPTLAGW